LVFNTLGVNPFIMVLFHDRPLDKNYVYLI